jgi:hypothetical protein
MRCIFGHVRALSRDLLYSNHSLSNFSGVAFLFLHSLGQKRPLDYRGRAQFCNFGVGQAAAGRQAHPGL